MFAECVNVQGYAVINREFAHNFVDMDSFAAGSLKSEYMLELSKTVRPFFEWFSPVG